MRPSIGALPGVTRRCGLQPRLRPSWRRISAHVDARPSAAPARRVLPLWSASRWWPDRRSSSYVGDALAPTLVDTHPLWLMALNSRTRNLALVTNEVDPVTFYGVGIARLLISDPLFFLLGYWYGDAAVEWMERRTKTWGQMLRQVEQWFGKAAYPIIFIAPNNYVCLFAGAAGMPLRAFFAVNIAGTIVPAVAGPAVRRGVRGARSTTSSAGSATTGSRCWCSASPWWCCRSPWRPARARPRCRRWPTSTTSSRTEADARQAEGQDARRRGGRGPSRRARRRGLTRPSDRLGATTGGCGRRAVGRAPPDARAVHDVLVGAQVGRDDPGVGQHLGGRAPGDDRAQLQGHEPVAQRRQQRHVVLDDDHRAAGLGLDPAQQRPERLGLALGHARRRLVEQHHRRVLGQQAGQLDDAAGAGRQLAGGLVGVGAEAQQLDELVDPLGGRAPRTSIDAGSRSAAASGSRLARCRSSATAMASSTVSDGKSSASWNDRPTPAMARRCGGQSVMSTPSSRTWPAVGRQEAGEQSNSVVLPAPLWPMSPTIVAGWTVEVDVVERRDAAEALGDAPGLERDAAASARSHGGGTPAPCAGMPPRRRRRCRCRRR